MLKVKQILLISATAALLFLVTSPGQLFREPRSAELLSSDGSLLGARISSKGQWYLPPAETVPERFAACIICYEDARFRLHDGVDGIAACRALVQNISRGEVVSGASTITMQTVRLSRPGAPRSIWEKLYEMYRARLLEMHWSKDRILLEYASNAPFGGNVVGLEAAAWRYFGRSPEDLSWGESATLAVLPNSPALVHPGRNRDALLAKRNTLLDKLCAKGLIDSTECLLAKDEPLPDRPEPMPDEAFHLLETLRARTGDGRIESTIDRSLQLRLNDIARKHFQIYHTNLVDNMGMLVVDVRSGNIIGYYGNTRNCGRGIRGSDVDMIPAPRSSGSTLKPLLYAAMLQDGIILPITLIKDTPYNHNNFSPMNYSRSFEGAVPANEVIARSLNVPSVRMLEQYGAGRFLELLRGLGFDTIDKDADHYGLSLILGGAEISLYNIARAYYRLAAELAGYPVADELSCLAGEKRGRLRSSDIPLGKAAVWLAFDALSNAARPEEESSWMDFSGGRRIAWKTGTSWGDRDAWSVGVTRDYVVAVWVGNSDGEGRAQMTGVSYAAPVMFDIFSCLPGSGWFDKPLDSMVPFEVCHESGLPAGNLCPVRDTIWVPDIADRPGTCTYHRLVHLDPSGSWQVNSDCCPVDEIRTEVRFILPPAQEWYYRRNHLDYKPLPPKHPLFDASSSGDGTVDIIYPQPGVTIVAARGFDSRKQGAVFRAAHSDPGATLFWHLDDEYLGETSGDHEMTVLPGPGSHVLTVVDGSGSRKSVRFEAK